MPQHITEYKCLLISPGDVVAERDALTDMVQSWNAQIGRALNVRLDLVRWELHGTPDMSQGRKLVLKDQLLEDCEVGLAVFWTRASIENVRTIVPWVKVDIELVLYGLNCVS